MTDLETEIRATLAAAAAAVPEEAAPAHLLTPTRVPARPVSKWRRNRWLAPALAAVVAVLLIGGIAGVVATGHHSSPRRAATPPPAPSSFVGVVATGPARDTISVISSATAAVRKVLVKTGADFTNNGLAVSPDGAYVYATWITRPSVVIKQISVATGRVRTIADGSEPAVSPDGRFLAYIGDGEATVVLVRDLRTGTTRSWSLSGVAPGCANIRSVVWLGDGSRVVIRPEDCPVRTSGSADQTSSSTLPALVVVDPSAPGSRPRGIALPVPKYVNGVHSAGSAAPDSVLVDVLTRTGETIYRVRLVDNHATVTDQAGLNHSLLMAVDHSGRHLLYLMSNPRTHVRIATLADGRITGVRRLAAAPSLAAAAW
ncbi:MAG: TolB family protein [Mycobacteriales bacterium]